MKSAVVGLMVVGVIAALAAALLTAAVRAGVGESKAPALPSEMTILVATRDLSAMTVIDANAVAVKTVRSTEAPVGVLTSPVQVIGQVLVTKIIEGEAFTVEKLAKDENRLHLAMALPEGGRAMTVVINNDSGIEHLLYPGSVVDVVASFRLPAVKGTPSGEIVSATLLQAIQVLAVGRDSVVAHTQKDSPETDEHRATRRSVVTLLVDSKQAEALQLAQMHGTIALALRNPLDKHQEGLDGMLLSDLSGEIAQRLGLLGQSNIGTNPLNLPEAVTSNAGATGDDEAVEDTATVPEWVLTVVRGRNTETRSFKMDEQTATE